MSAITVYCSLPGQYAMRRQIGLGPQVYEHWAFGWMYPELGYAPRWVVLAGSQFDGCVTEPLLERA